MIPSYPFECPECEADFDLVMRISTYEGEQMWDCPKCEMSVTKGDRVMVTSNVTRASYVDGTKRPGFAEQKLMHKLKLESYNMPHEKRGDIKKEIKNIERSGKK